MYGSFTSCIWSGRLLAMVGVAIASTLYCMLHDMHNQIMTFHHAFHRFIVNCLLSRCYLAHRFINLDETNLSSEELEDHCCEITRLCLIVCTSSSVKPQYRFA